MPRLGPHADVHMRDGLVVVWHHHVLVVRQLGLCELTRCPLDDQRVGVPGHGQHDVEGLATVAFISDLAAPVELVVGQFVYGRFAPHRVATVVLDGEPAVLADVVKVCRIRQHAPPSPGDLDHDLRRPFHHSGFDALADGVGEFVGLSPRSRGDGGTLTTRLPG